MEDLSDRRILFRYRSVMTISKKIVLDEQGEPSEVLIPYEQFMELAKRYGWDLEETSQIEISSETFGEAMDRVFDHHAPLLKKLSE